MFNYHYTIAFIIKFVTNLFSTFCQLQTARNVSTPLSLVLHELTHSGATQCSLPHVKFCNYPLRKCRIIVQNLLTRKKKLINTKKL